MLDEVVDELKKIPTSALSAFWIRFVIISTVTLTWLVSFLPWYLQVFGLFSVGFLVFAAKALKIKILAGSATDPEKQEAEERPAIVLAMSPKSDKQEIDQSWHCVNPSKVVDFVKTISDKTCISLGEKFKEEHLEKSDWLNLTLQHLFRNMRAGMEDIILNIIWPQVWKQLQDLPINLEIELYTLSLGMVAPTFDEIKVLKEIEDSIVLDLALSYPSEAAMQVKIKTDVIPKMTAEISSILLTLSIRITIRNVSSHPPFIQGFEVSCKNYPEIEWCLKVLGSNMSKIAGLDRTIKQLIRDNVKMLVYPKKLCFPVAMIPLDPLLKQKLGLKDGYDPCFRMVIPHPRGVVRIKIKNVIFDSPREYLLLKTRDPYLLIRVGSAEFRSKTKTRTSRPEFNVLCEIPVDITTDMKVEIYLMDDDLGTDQEIGRFVEKLEFIEHCCEGEQALRWNGLLGRNPCKIFSSAQWISQSFHLDETWSGSGVLAFSCVRLRGTSLIKPKLTLKLDDYTPEIGEHLIERSWDAITAFKTLEEFRICPLDRENWDLFLLQGGKMRLLPGDSRVWIIVHDLLDRRDEVGRREWKGEVHLSQILKAGKSPLEIKLRIGYTKPQILANKLRKRIREQGQAIIGISPSKLKSKESEKLRVTLQFSVYKDKE
ncbi:uncharacterized protein LOC111703647 [Eurytemora carolleeae]|uniref:uncharacterized protein LOC111703647 n=1 Tax=Eurytemora carolleeae TaxID=1294199 RepID=UPI000C77256F|nr:uncharacterized protein LOC111703647 [Eurytemora carolleeae]|eukprot:XP_023331432.1 uncharacterized protein LOC111703647 [Eurytemora affinis]